MGKADTKTRIMDIAEELFAARGYEGTSLRDITGKAGTNLGAVNYHFQSKEGLLSAIFERHLGPVNRERLAALDDAEAGDGPPELEAVLRAFLGPPFSRLGKMGAFMRLAGRMHSETSEELQASFRHQFVEVFRRFSKALRNALPDLDRDEVALRTQFLIGSMAHTLLWSKKMLGPPFGRRRTLDPEEALGSLLRFAVPGMSAPMKSPRKRGKR